MEEDFFEEDLDDDLRDEDELDFFKGTGLLTARNFFEDFLEELEKDFLEELEDDFLEELEDDFLEEIEGDLENLRADSGTLAGSSKSSSS
jgi:hypothetical protein